MADRKPVPGMDPNVVEYDEDNNIVLTGTDIPAGDDDIRRATNMSGSDGGADGGSGSGGL